MLRAYSPLRSVLLRLSTRPLEAGVPTIRHKKSRKLTGRMTAYEFLQCFQPIPIARRVSSADPRAPNP